MRWNKVGILLLVLSMTGCSLQFGNTQGTIKAEYEAMVPFETSDTRIKHVGLISNMDIRLQMEKGLLDLSKAHFSPSEVGFRSHVFLDFDTLDATDGSRGLLGTNRDDNPNGLNPAREEAFDTGNGTVTGATILIDIYELDFYKGEKLEGISLGLIVDDSLEQDGQDIPINEDVMENYIEVTSNKLVSYMRERFNEISRSIPIYVAAFQLNSEDASSNGRYIYEGYFEQNRSSFSKIEETWVNIPTETFTQMDAQSASEFTTFQQDVASVLPDQTYVVGKAHFKADKVEKMEFTVNAYGKTASEILAVCQTVRKSLENFSNTDCMYYVEILNDNDVYAMIQRMPDTKETTIISIV